MRKNLNHLVYYICIIVSSLFISLTAAAQSNAQLSQPVNDLASNYAKPLASGPAANLLDDGHFHEDPNVPHNLPFAGACVPGTVNRFTGSWHSNLYIGNNSGANALVAWGQNMSLYITGAGTDYTSPQIIPAANYNGIPYEVKSTTSGGSGGLSVLAVRTSTRLYIFGTAANITAITTMASFGGASLGAANSNVTAKLPAGVAVTDIAEMEISPSAFAILTNAGHVYILTRVANLQGDKAGAGPAIWHHVTLTDGVTFLSGVTKISLSGSGVLACTSTNKLYYWGSPANVAGTANTSTSYNYAYDMSAKIPAGTVVKDVVCLGNDGPSASTLFILCSNRKVYGCGLNANGCLGINNATTTFNQINFVTVKGTDGVTDLSGIVKIDGDTEGDVHCIGAISNTGQVYGWGNSPAGMLGVNASTSDFSVPKTVQLFSPTPGLNYNDFSVAGHFTIAFYSNGATDQYWYLGHNIGGSLGNPSNMTTFILAASPASLASSGGVTYECSNVFLPLTWLGFNVQKQATSVLLNWSTTNEINTTNFLVQHSTDGNSWQTIGTVASAGNSTSTEHYAYTHSTPAKGYNYYRVLQQDVDGRSTYSKTLNVIFTSKANPVILYSNRIVNGTLELQIEESTVITVYSAAGALVIQQKLAAGRQTINVGNLAKGTYMLKTANGAEKFFIQ